MGSGIINAILDCNWIDGESIIFILSLLGIHTIVIRIKKEIRSFKERKHEKEQER